MTEPCPQPGIITNLKKLIRRKWNSQSCLSLGASTIYERHESRIIGDSLNGDVVCFNGLLCLHSKWTLGIWNGLFVFLCIPIVTLQLYQIPHSYTSIPEFIEHILHVWTNHKHYQWWCTILGTCDDQSHKVSLCDMVNMLRHLICARNSSHMQIFLCVI